MTSPELRIGDSDREAAVTALGEHYAAGRLTKDELDERSDLAWAARTASALRPLLADLPGPGTARAEAPEQSGPGRSPGWPGLGLAPVLAVVALLVVLTHLPLLVLLVLGWFVVVRSGHRWGHRRGHRHGHRDHWVR